MSTILSLSADTEISQFEHSTLVKKNVSWLDISVHYLLLVQVSETLQDLNCDEADDLLRNGSNFLKYCSQRADIHKLKSDIDTAFSLKGSIRL